MKYTPVLHCDCQAAQAAERELDQARKNEASRKEYEDFLRWKSARAGRPWYNSPSGQ